MTSVQRKDSCRWAVAKSEFVPTKEVEDDVVLLSVSVWLWTIPVFVIVLPLHFDPRWRKMCIASFISRFYENCPTHYKYKTKQYSSPLLWNDQRSTSTRTNTLKHTLASLSMLVEKKSTKQTKQAACIHIHIYIYKISIECPWPPMTSIEHCLCGGH